MHDVVEWAKKNPAMAGLIAVFCVALIWILSRGSGASTGGDNSAASAYFAANAAQAVSGNQLMAVQLQEQGDTARTQIAAGASVQNNSTWASTDLGMLQSNNDTTLGLAPYKVQDDLISALGTVAQQPGTVTTSGKGKGFNFGLDVSKGGGGGGGGIAGALGFGSSKTSITQTYNPNPAAVSAAGNLTTITNSVFAQGTPATLPPETGMYGPH